MSRFTMILLGSAFVLGCAGGQTGGETGLEPSGGRAHTGGTGGDDTGGGAGVGTGDTPESDSTGGRGSGGWTHTGGNETGGFPGNVGASECTRDADCAPHLTQWTEPLGTFTLISAHCGHPNPVNDPFPVCSCRVSLARADGTAPFETGLYPGGRYQNFQYSNQGACSEFGRTPQCLYCADAFPGCSIDSEDSCQSVCKEFVKAANEQYQAELSASVRLARCTVDQRCERITEIEGRCYVGEVPADDPGYDCSLSDQELLGMPERFVSSCPGFEETPCETAEDCPRGLACNDGVCGACSDACSSTTGEPDTWDCDGDAACASGELCALGVCVLEKNLECRFSSDCPTDQACVLSGLDLKKGRGNAATRAFCQTDPRVGCSMETQGWTPDCIP
jgi:hypothetical protein